jgi:hypothetical protein
MPESIAASLADDASDPPSVAGCAGWHVAMAAPHGPLEQV